MKPFITVSRGLLAAACASFLLSACGTPPELGHRLEQAPARAPEVSQGVVRSIDIIDAPAAATGAGAALGGIAGGLLGHQVGDGGGRTAATLAGAVGGAIFGGYLEQRQRAKSAGRVYRVVVQFDNGATQGFDFRELDGLRVGQRVNYRDGVLSRG